MERSRNEMINGKNNMINKKSKTIDEPVYIFNMKGTKIIVYQSLSVPFCNRVFRVQIPGKMRSIITPCGAT